MPRMISTTAGGALRGGRAGTRNPRPTPIPGSADVILTRERQGREAALKEKTLGCCKVADPTVGHASEKTEQKS